MIKRPLNERFRQAVLDGRKVTTIRDNPWPVGQPIMLYSWEGKPYRSKQVDLCPVIVEKCHLIGIHHDEVMGMRYSITTVEQIALWETEGFASRAEMDAWFRAITKPGTDTEKWLMMFSRQP